MKIDPNAPVFPGQEFSSEVGANSHLERGLAIRAYFAAMALQGLLANPVVMQTVGSRGSDPGPELAKSAVDSADYLIAELNK